MTLTQTAPAGGSNVTLASNNASLTVPASVLVAVGATTATFSATAASIASNQSAAVTATLGSSSQTATIGLLAPGAGFDHGLRSRQSRAKRRQHLYGDADPDRSRGRIERNAGQQQRFAHCTGFGPGSGGSHDRNLQRNGGGQHRRQSERGRHRHPRQQFANGHHRPADAGAGLDPGLRSRGPGSGRFEQL